MAKPVNLIRNVNGVLITKNVNFFGKRWAVQDGADGYSSIDVVVTDTTQDVKLYLEGSNDITVFPVTSDVSKLCKSALTSFPKINTIFLFSATKVNIEEQTKGLGDYLSYLSLLSKIYVPSALLNNYQSSYASLSSKFDIIVEDLTITIEWVGNNALTSEEITRQLNTLEPAYLNQTTKLVIDSRYTDYMDTLWAYNFTEKCSALNNNIWHGTDKVDLTSKTLTGGDELLESDVDNFIATISADKLSGVLELHFEGFSDMSVALTYDYSALVNLDYVWLDNVRYDANELQNASPIGYQFVEYIGSSGTQYINTLFAPNENSGVEFEFKVPTNTNGKGLLGVYKSSSIMFVLHVTSQSAFSYWYGNESGAGVGSISANTKYKIKIDKNKLYIDDVLIFTATEQTFSTDENMFIFGRNQGGNLVTPSSYDLYPLKVFDNNVEVRNFRPCYRLSDNEIGLYDKINNQFYANQGSGTFTKGNDLYKATYFYPIADLSTYYDARYTQTFYLDYNGTLPSYPNYQLTYYTDINCTTSILPENMQSGTRYYAKAVMVTLTIQGSGALTSAIVEPQVAKAGSGVTKVVIPDTFTNYDNNALEVANALTNVDTLEYGIYIRPANDYQVNGTNYPLWSQLNAGGRVKNFIYTNSKRSGVNAPSAIYLEDQSLGLGDGIPFAEYKLAQNSVLYFKNVENAYYWGGNFMSPSSGVTGIKVYAPKVTNRILARSNYSSSNSKGYFPLVNNKELAQDIYYQFGRGYYTKLFVTNIASDLLDNSYVPSWTSDTTLYFSPTLNNITAWFGTTNAKVVIPHAMVIDGNDVYADVGYDTHFNYSKLTGIDTEANIQLLTPIEDVLYLASDTGDLWQYSNGAWINLFANLTGITWYSDEDCTTSVLPNAMDTAHTYYVKASGTRGYNFATDSWTDIKYCLDNNIAHYNLGDTKTITYNNSTYTIRICDLGSRYDITNGNGAKNHIVCEFVEIVRAGIMNDTQTLEGGWGSCYMKTTTMPNIYNNLPSDLKSVISDVQVASANDGSASGSGSLSYSSNYLFLASEYEITGTIGVSNSIEQTTQFGLYQENNTASFRIKNYNDTASNWWLRSPRPNTQADYCLVGNGGGINGNWRANQFGISPFFCL